MKAAGPIRGIALAVALALLAPCAAAAPAEPQGYRMEDYRAPTPASLRGATVLDTSAAERLWHDKIAAFIDVLPRAQKPQNLPPGTIWRDKRRENIPGSAWLANVGYGALSAEMDAYFRRSLDEITTGDRAHPIVFYCQAECWMSWNAAKRALSYGYSDVSWYPAGTDGWAETGIGLVAADPRP